MITFHTLRSEATRPALLSAILLVLVAGAAQGTSLEATPAQIEFKSVKDTAEITLENYGMPVNASSVQSVKLLVGRHDYDHMIDVSKKDGKLVVRPTDMLELGTYDLAVTTTHGTVSVQVLALLEIVDISLQARASRLGVTVEEIKAQLGISQQLGQARLQLNLPPLYYIGQALEMNIPVAEGRTPMWSVNGEEIAPNHGDFRYVFEHLGVYDFGYVEKIGDRIIAYGIGTIQVVQEPRIPVTVASGTALTLRAPEGFGTFSWTVDGGNAADGDSWTTTFDSPGEHTVTVRASEPASGTKQAFRIITYVITVT